MTSVGSRGDSYDNALAESVIGLYKAELVHRRGPWRGLDDLELATLEWVDWYNHRRLHSALDYLPPAEYERNQERELVSAGAGIQCTESPLNPGRFNPTRDLVLALREVLGSRAGARHLRGRRLWRAARLALGRGLPRVHRRR